jgi:RNA polymerase sigma-70 factor (ECF subfamily)
MKAEDLFDILVRQHAEMLTAYLRSFAFDESIVDDAFQETIITAWRRLDEFDRTKPFGPWLRGIARNHVLVMARGKRRYAAHVAELLQRRIDAQVSHVDAKSGDTFGERMAALRECLSQLQPDAREALDLAYVRGLDSHSAARSLGLAEETFRKRLYRARLTIASCLRTRGVFHPDDLPGDEAGPSSAAVHT